MTKNEMNAVKALIASYNELEPASPIEILGTLEDAGRGNNYHAIKFRGKYAYLVAAALQMVIRCADVSFESNNEVVIR